MDVSANGKPEKATLGASMAHSTWNALIQFSLEDCNVLCPCANHGFAIDVKDKEEACPKCSHFD
jgi:hypothetical protein